MPPAAAAAQAVVAGLLPGSAENARTIGRALLAAHPHLAERDTCLAEMQARLGNSRGAARRRAARAAVAADFDAGRTVLVDGWILSQFEVRLCVLHALA